MMDGVEVGRVNVAARGCGIALRAFELGIAYAQRRHAFGQPIAQHQAIKSLDPHLIFTHYGKDAHQDHRLISDLTWNTFREHLILEYEIPKYDGDLGRPNVFVPLEAGASQKKVDSIIGTFQSQRSKRWFEPETFFSLMRLRGMECNAPSGYAEAFYCRKLLL